MDFDRLLEHFTERCRQGRAASIEKYARKFPRFAEQIRELFPTIREMEDFKREHWERPGVQGKHPERVGDFQIVREIGRGGMGVVYEAVQHSLQRRVALKLLNEDSNRSRKKLARFVREARSAARLHHTNIVPVFGYGAHEQTHFYAMQYIDGANLDEVFAELRAWRDRLGLSFISDCTVWHGPVSVIRPRFVASRLGVVSG